MKLKILCSHKWHNIVTGIIRDPHGTPIPHLIVRANDVDLDKTAFLGETFTNEQGRYKIIYTSKQLTHKGKKRANLRVEVLSYTGQPLGESDIRFNAGRWQVIDMTIEAPAKLTEYEQLVGTLRFMIGEKQLHQLTEEEISFFLRQLDQDPPSLPFVDVINEYRLRSLVQSAILTDNTGIPETFFYGLARVQQVELPLTLAAFLELSENEIRDLLTRAGNEEIIPALPWEEIKESWDKVRIDQDSLIRRRLAGRLLNEENGEPLVKYNVRATHLDNETDLGQVLTGSDGVFVFNYLTAKDAVNNFRLEVSDFSGEIIHSTPIEIDASDRVIEIRIAVPAAPDTSPDLLDLSDSLGLDIPQGLPEVLESQGINSLADLRTLGGFDNIENLPIPADHPTLRRLEAHANLFTLAGYEPGDADKLIDAGFDRISKIAATDRPTFVGQTHQELARLY